ncbi:hypothetical protein WJX81_002268 [Elliptochloris bilobata]|uniref:Uncharacterized protein n=1 Tax=Elliptochloris bilobata TaxID=381761 RepID=A0AAW1QKK9_9CHLO
MSAGGASEPFDYLLKILLVGDSGVGKSSLLMRFTADQFEDSSAPTIGVDFRLKFVTVSDKRLKLTIWDTAGQERFRTLTSSYYRGAQGIVFAYDVTRRETFESIADIWMREVDMYSTVDNAVKMVVANKVDKQTEREVSRDEGAAFARKHGCLFVETSAKANVAVGQAFEELVRKVLEAPGLLTPAHSSGHAMPLKVKREREEPCHVCQHYHDYEGGEPCGVCGHRLEPQQAAGPQESVYPTEVLPGFLFLGSYDNASRTEVLKTLGITHVLNTVPACPELYKNSFSYHTVRATPPDYQECFAFLDQVEREQGKLRVLVHCMTGVSKSPAVVIAYIMKLRQWRLSESYKWVKDKRPTISLSAEEAQRLQALEVSLLGASSTGWQPSAGVPAAMPIRV